MTPNSPPEEGFTQGDSEFRKATILLIVTWAPFPLWYFFSPEGLSIITNTLIVQLGWAACGQRRGVSAPGVSFGGGSGRSPRSGTKESSSRGFVKSGPLY